MEGVGCGEVTWRVQALEERVRNADVQLSRDSPPISRPITGPPRPPGRRGKGPFSGVSALKTLKQTSYNLVGRGSVGNSGHHLWFSCRDELYGAWEPRAGLLQPAHWLGTTH